ncbi:LacI family DNA-binding transcriptional regulator [Breznakiellaceae bacterium SP9]
MINIKDIASQVGVSVSTVSRVVNGKSNVSLKKREQIQKIIKETGYVPNKAARIMVMKRSFAVGIVIPASFGMFQRQLFSVIEQQLVSLGYHTLTFFITINGQSEGECLSRLKAEKLDGVILMQELWDPSFYETLAYLQIPVVASSFRASGIPSIHVNEEAAAVDGVNHLITLGHKRINMLCGSNALYGQQRLKGYYKALCQAGIADEEQRVFFAQSYTMAAAMQTMHDMLHRCSDFTAVYAASDDLAVAAIRALKDAGRRVPEDVSVLGFDDIQMADFYVPRLSTIRQPLEDIGALSAQTLHAIITGETEVHDETILSHELVIRESTAKPVIL